MGMRQNIKLTFENKKKIYIYSHWDGDDGDSPLKSKLRLALRRGRERWDDDSYLARIIFSEVIAEDVNGLTGYGLSPYEIDPEFPTIEVDMQKRAVDGIPFEQFVLQG